MKKLILTFAALVAVAVPARAQSKINAQPTNEIASFKMSCSSFTFNTTAAEVSSNTAVSSTTYAVSSISVTNLDTAANICCSDNPSVSCTALSPLYGDPVAGASSGQKNKVTWVINPYQKWYCASSANLIPGVICKKR
jgi:hypothetical protein